MKANQRVTAMAKPIMPTLHHGWEFEFSSTKPAKAPTYYGEYKTRFGHAVCVVTDKALIRLVISDYRNVTKLLEEVATQYGTTPIHNNKLTDPYLEKALTPNKQIKHIQMVGTHFQLQVWKALLTIPEGETRSYVDIAKQIKNPNAMRAVGGAVGQNPVCLLVPCHRVIRHDGTIGGYGGGLGVKRKLLAYEGLPQFLK